MDPATDAALAMPEILAGVLRFLGPLDWLKCAAVCSWWSTAILDDSSPPPTKAKATSTAAATASTAATVAARRSSTQFGSVNLWREFAFSVMHYQGPELDHTSDGTLHPFTRRLSGGGEAGNCRDTTGYDQEKANTTDGDRGNGDGVGSVSGGDGEPAEESATGNGERCHATSSASVGTRGGRCSSEVLSWSNNSSSSRGKAGARLAKFLTYKRVCLEGDPEQLGPPLRLTHGFVCTTSIAPTALARARQPRALVKFLKMWFDDYTIIDSNKVKGANTSRARAKHRKKSKRDGSALCYPSAADVRDALSHFTRRLVLCRRCRGSCTTLYASREPRNAGHCSNGRALAQPGTRAATRTYLHCEAGRLLLWVECHRQGCEMAFGVAVDGGPRWLVKFAEYVLHHDWEDINTLPADHGTEWFSDTSPEAVMQRQEEARAKSHGLDALASQISDSF